MLFYVLFTPNVEVSVILNDSNSSNFFDICKFICDNGILYSIEVYNDIQLDDEKFDFYMKNPNTLIFPADISTDWSFL